MQAHYMWAPLIITGQTPCYQASLVSVVLWPKGCRGQDRAVCTNNMLIPENVALSELSTSEKRTSMELISEWVQIMNESNKFCSRVRQCSFPKSSLQWRLVRNFTAQDVGLPIAPACMYWYTPCSSTIVPVLQQTWGSDAEENIAYYSEVADPQYSTTDIGIPNTERGAV